MKNQKHLESLQTEWDQATERAALQVERDEMLGDMLTVSAGLHIKSGIESGGLWGTTSCTCENSCTCGATCS